MFEDEKRKLEERKKSIGRVEVPKDMLHAAVERGFEKAKKEQTLKRSKLIKRSSWSVAIAAILFVSFITSVFVSPVFADKVASIPGMEHIVGLIHQDRGITAAIENDFYQPLNLSQEKNGITATLDGVIADKKGMIIFYTIQSKKENHPLQIEKIRVMNDKHRNLLVSDTTSWNSASPVIEQKTFSSMMTLETYEKHTVPDGTLIWSIDLKNGKSIEHFEIPFAFKKSYVESKIIELNKEVTIEGQRITVEKVTFNPIRAEVKLKIDPSNSKRVFSFENLKFTNDIGEEWIVNNIGTMFGNVDGTEWTITLQSPYFNKSDKLKMEFGKIAAIDKDETYILIDTESKKFLKQPEKSIFSNLESENNKVSFIIDMIDGKYNMLVGSSFRDDEGKEFFIKHGSANPMPGEKYVNGSLDIIDGKGLRLEFELPAESISNPLRFDLYYYPCWIEENVEIDIRQ